MKRNWKKWIVPAVIALVVAAMLTTEISMLIKATGSARDTPPVDVIGEGVPAK